MEFVENQMKMKMKINNNGDGQNNQHPLLIQGDNGGGGGWDQRIHSHTIERKRLKKREERDNANH